MDKSVFTLRPENESCDCIICHKKDVPMSDEHIIPKALGGYMHTWKVCKTCNSVLGEKIDTKLTDHEMMKWERYEHQLKGESGKDIPCPIEGTHFADDGKKYRIVKEADGFVTHCIPEIKKSSDGKQITLTIDPDEINSAEKIISKYCKRNGLGFDKDSLSASPVRQKPSPGFEMQMEIDLSNFKMGLLKIAYEFTACLIDDYVNDPEACKISSILHHASEDRLDEVDFGGTGFDDVFPKLFGNYIDFTKDSRHYIMLTSLNGQTWCLVRLFNVFCLAMKMSDRSYPLSEEKIIAINDFRTHDFELFTLSELINKVCHSKSVGYEFPEYHRLKLQKYSYNSRIAFYCNDNHQNLCFDECGNIMGTDVDIIAKWPEALVEMNVGEGRYNIIYHICSKVFLKILPSNELYPLDKVIVENSIDKI